MAFLKEVALTDTVFHNRNLILFSEMLMPCKVKESHTLKHYVKYKLFIKLDVAAILFYLYVPYKSI